MFIFGKRKLSHVLAPITHIFTFLLEAKATFILLVSIAGIYVASVFKPELFLPFLHYPSNILSSKIYTLITSGFLHAHLPHLLGNMLALFIFGRVVERKLSSLATVSIFFTALILSGIFSSLIHLFILQDNTPGLGASGAIMGLVAAAILLDPFSLTWELLIPIPIMIIGWIALFADLTGVLNPTESGIGHLAHLGGFICITFFAYALGRRPEWRRGLVINLVSFMLLLIFFTFYY